MIMDIQLTPYQVRVLGSMIEKEVTTPDQYPLSLNALTNACNQKSSRDPVLALNEETVQQTVDELLKQRLVMEKTGFGSRVVKYQQRFCNTEFSTLQFSPQELGVICVLLLRGPQTPGELRTRCSRLCRFHDMREVENIVQGLMSRDDGPFVTPLPRQAGKREVRYAHLFSGEIDEAITEGEVYGDAGLPSPEISRLLALEEAIADLRQEMAGVKEEINRLARQTGTE